MNENIQQIQKNERPRASGLLVGLGILSLAASLLGPILFDVDPEFVKDARVRWTVRVSLLFWFLALVGRLTATTAWASPSHFVRWSWTLGWLAYIVHVLVAFDHVHHWSHAEAFDHVQKRSGFGPGIFVSHLFTLLWTLDVVFDWFAPSLGFFRPLWFQRFLLGFMVFVTFNATVVYETGAIRWVAGVGFAFLTLLLIARFFRPSTILEVAEVAHADT